MANNELTAKLAELKELKNMLEELNAEISTIEDEVKAEMTARNVDELTAGAFKVRWKTIESARFDTKAFKAEMPELAARFTIKTTAKRFTVA